MTASTPWLSRVTPREDIGYREIVSLGSLDPYGQHQALYRLFHLPPREERVGQPTTFLFRAEQHEGVPVFYLLSLAHPQDHEHLWRVESKPYVPDVRSGDRLAFKLRANPIVSRGTEARGRGRRHDIVMDTKLRLGWKDLPPARRPSLAELAQQAGTAWLKAREDRLGARLLESSLRADGYQTWRQRSSRGIALATLDFEGILTVTDPARFRSALLTGIGPAKAFGCGLLLVRRL